MFISKWNVLYNNDWKFDAFSARTDQLQIPPIFIQSFKSQYFLFIRSSREVPRIYGKSGNSHPARSTLLYILLARFPLCIQRRFFRSCSSPADSRLLSLITTVRYLTRASWDALEIGSGRMIHFIYSAGGTSVILLGSESNPLLRISRRVTCFCVIYRVFRRRWQNTIRTNSARWNASLVQRSGQVYRNTHADPRFCFVL